MFRMFVIAMVLFFGTVANASMTATQQEVAIAWFLQQDEVDKTADLGWLWARLTDPEKAAAAPVWFLASGPRGQREALLATFTLLTSAEQDTVWATIKARAAARAQATLNDVNAQ